MIAKRKGKTVANLTRSGSDQIRLAQNQLDTLGLL